MSSRTAKEFTTGEVLTAANMNKPAGGWLGYAANSSDQSGITTLTDVNNVTVTVTVGTGRLLLVMVTGLVTVTGTVSAWYGTIVEDSSTIGRWARVTGMANNDVQQFTGWTITTPSAGTHTYKAQAAVTSGAGTLEVSGTAPGQAKIVVVDLGAST